MNKKIQAIISSCNQVYFIYDQEDSSFDLNWSIPISNLSASSDIITNAFIFTQSSDINSISYAGQVNTYSGGGYIYELRGSKEDILNSTEFLKSLKWIDSQTSAVFVEFSLFNPNINLFMYCSILFEITSAGSFVNTAQFYPIDLYTINQSQFISFRLVFSIIFMLLVVVLFVKEVKEIIEKEGWKFVFNAYNYIDLAIIAFSWSAFSIFLYRLYESNKVLTQIQNKDSTFINLQYLSYLNECFNYFMGICSACATIRLIKVFKFNKRIILFFIAFKQSLKEIFLFGFIFLVIWMAFVQILFCLMNDETILFSSIVHSMETCFQIILGKFNSSIFTQSKSALAPVLFVFYNIIIIFIFINLMVAILLENLHLAQKDENLERQDPELFSYLKSLFTYYIIDWIRGSNKSNVKLQNLNRIEEIGLKLKKVLLFLL